MARLQIHRLVAASLLIALLAGSVPRAWSQESDTPADSDSSLSLEQQSLAARFERLEAIAAKLAELAADSEPERAEQLRKAIRESREMGTRERFTTIVELLRKEQLSAASKDQDALQTQLRTLLDVLLADPTDDGREKLKDKLRGQIRDINRMIRTQRSLRSQNLNGRDANDVADAQGDLEEKAGDLEGEIREDNAKPGDEDPEGEEPSEGESSEGEPNEGEPSEGEPSDGDASEGEPSEGEPSEGEPSEGEPSEGQPSEGQPSEGQPSEGQPGSPSSGSPQSGEPPEGDMPPDAAQRIAAARQAMQEAEQKLRDAERDGAADKQREAQRQLEEARAELERILRQLREEEMEQLLTLLAARYREMLSLQTSILEETVLINDESKESADRTLRLRAVKLSRREADVLKIADRAMLLLREDGTSVAFVEALEQIMEDMQTVTDRLAKPDTGELTQSIEEEIIEALQESIEALDLALDELAQQKAQQGQGQGAGAPAEPPLVSKLAELKMIRTLQNRINRRTERLNGMLEEGEVTPADVKSQLDELAKRQFRVFEATRDLDSGRNQ